MKYLLKALLVIIFLLSFCTKTAYAIYDPLSVSNNKFGIHILFTSELSEAAHLVNSTGGDWGYVTIPIQASDKDLVKWQNFMNDCSKYHLIPIIRIATTGDYFKNDSWSKPTDYDIIDFANFLNSLLWPTKNRYVVIFNETNRADEWGGLANPDEYANLLSFAVDTFKQKNDDFFIISGGLDNASINSNNTYSYYTYMQQMEKAVPGIFSKVDGLASHSYPNPAFSMPPSSSREGIYSFNYQQQLAYNLSGKKLPVFITETGWSSDKVPLNTQSQYYIQSFANYWSNDTVIAVTPFILNASQGTFQQFSFIKNNIKSNIYFALFNIKKEKGNPLLNQIYIEKKNIEEKYPTQKFKSISIESLFKRIETPQKQFLKWIFGI